MLAGKPSLRSTFAINPLFRYVQAMKKLYLVHCGFYDTSLLDGIYESHVNFFVPAESFEEARVNVKFEPEFRDKKMHVDGLQEIHTVQGYQVIVQEDPSLEGKTKIISSRHRDLAPKLEHQKKRKTGTFAEKAFHGKRPSMSFSNLA